MPAFLVALPGIIGAAASAVGSSIVGGLAAIGGGSAVAGAGIVGSTAATIGSSVAAATRKAPEMPQAPTPEPAQATAAVATERKQLQQKAGYRSTLLTNQLSNYSANPGGKTLLGQ
jgi:hypothetical protein